MFSTPTVYRPIDIGLQLVVEPYDLVDFTWRPNGPSADFSLRSSEHLVLRVAFETACIVRLLDEMPLSTEEDPRNQIGLVPGHFAYVVEGAAFATSQSAAWKDLNSPATHYRFATGWTCLDVLTVGAPSFSLIERP